MANIAIVGGGIMGLSVGVMIQERIPGAQVTIYADALTPYTTGDVAAGLWGPYAINNDPRIVKWAKITYDYLCSLVRHPEQRKTGVSLLHGYRLDGIDSSELPFWGHIPHEMRRMKAEELALFPEELQGGWMYIAPMCEGKKHNSWLLHKFLNNGGNIVKAKIESFAELAHEPYHCIVNCSGLGARRLCGDTEMFPVRGQVRRVRAPWITNFITTNTKKGAVYIIPNSESVVLGGTAQKHDWNENVTEVDLQHIIESTSEMYPSLKEAEVIVDQVGLRPGRTSVRLELETMEIDGKELKVIHNYGHGGSGFTLFRGCALDVLEILNGVLQSA